jgi:short subunit dehydrogenase-like uncharacterized protein
MDPNTNIEERLKAAYIETLLRMPFEKLTQVMVHGMTEDQRAIILVNAWIWSEKGSNQYVRRIRNKDGSLASVPR